MARDLFEEAGISVAGSGRDLFAEAGIDFKGPKREAVPNATPLSFGQDVLSGALQIGPTFVKGVADIGRLATGDRIGKDTSEAMETGIKSIQDVVGSERGAAQRKNFQADMADENVNFVDAIRNNKGALADQVLPTLGSMILPVGVAGAAGKFATLGKAVQNMDKATIAARVLSAQKAAGIGTVAAQNASDTFAELIDRGVPMEDAYLGAGITVPFSVVAGKLTGGGAEQAITSALTRSAATKLGVKSLAKATGQEGAQEMGEEIGQITGEAVATDEMPTANTVSKRLAVAGTLGAVMGGGANAATQTRDVFGKQQEVPAVAQPETPEVTAPTAPEQPAPAVTANEPTRDPFERLAEISLISEQRELTPAESGEYTQLVTQIESGEAYSENEVTQHTITAPDIKTAVQTAAQQYGPDAIITNHENTPDGVALTVAVPDQAGAVPASSSAIGELQNRDRSRAASVNQMQSIARNPDYMRLGPSRTPDSGAPMVFATGNDLSAIQPTHFGRDDIAVMADGQRVPFRYAVVDANTVNPSNFADGTANPAFESGEPGALKALNNGRTAGMRAAHGAGNGQAYTAELIADAQSHGVPVDAIRSTPNPMLVRVYSEGSNTNDMAAKSQGQGLGMSPAELAQQDAPLIDLSALAVYEPGDIASAGNRDFVRSFVGGLQASGQDIAPLITADGQLSQMGRQRIQAALMQSAYGDVDLVQEMFDSVDTDIKAIGEALKSVAGAWAGMRQAAKIGAINPETDITGNLVQVVRMIQQARRNKTSIYDMINQRDLMTGETPDALTVSILRLFYTGNYLTRAVGKERLIDSLSRYLTGAMQTQEGGGLFGDTVTAQDILNAITQDGKNDGGNQAENGSSEPGSSGIARGGADRPGAQASRPGTDEAGRGIDEAGREAPAQDQPEASAQEGGEGVGAEGLTLTGETNTEAAANAARTESDEVSKAQADRERDAVPFSLATESQPKPVGVQGGLKFSKSPGAPSRQFVTAPDGSIDFGEITENQSSVMRRQPGKIRLTIGIQNADGTGHGLVHIEANHGKQIRNAGFGSVEEFVSHVASSFGQVWGAPGVQLLATVRDGKQRMMYVELEQTVDKDGEYYRVNSAFPVRQEDYPERHGFKKLWDGSEPASAVTGEQPAFAGQSESSSGQTTPNARSQSDSNIQPTLEDIKSGWKDRGITANLFENKGVITLSRIVVPEGQRDQGIGTQAMQELVDYADANGKHIALSPSADFGGNKKRLIDFYKRFGFVENKGRNRAFSVSESMVRENPNATAPLYSFAGQSAATADTHALATAQQRLKDGEDAETVRKETGWFIGADGKPRFEIDDSQASLKKPYPNKGQRWGDVWKSQLPEGSTLGKMLDHPALFAAYPSLASIPVSTKKGTGASYSVESRQIDLGEDVPMYDVLSTLLHEIQHGIQTIEDFATGGRSQGMSAIESSPEYRKWNTARLAMPLNPSPAQVSATMDLYDKIPSKFDAYKRLAGEVEARNVQSRQNLTAEERRNQSPESTQDVANSDVIIVFNGKEMASAPMPANAAGYVAPITEQQATAAITNILGKAGKLLIDAGQIVLVRTEEGLKNLPGAVAWSKSANDLQSNDGLPNESHVNRTIDAAELVALRGAASRLERPQDGVFLRVTEDGRAIATGPKGTRIPDAFVRFAKDHDLAFEARRNGEGRKSNDVTVGKHITSKTEPMPPAYREAGALYFGEGNVYFDRTGKTRFAKDDGAIQGATLPDGRIVLVLENLTEDNIAGVLKHEGFHATIRALVGEETYQQIMAKLGAMRKAGNGAAWFKQALAAVPDGTAESDVNEEIGAYAIEQHENGEPQPLVIRNWVKSLLSALRTAIIQRMPAGKLKNWAIANITGQDMARLAVAGLRAKASRIEQAQAQGRYVRNEKDLAASTKPGQLNLPDLVQKAQGLGINVLNESDIVNLYGSRYSRASAAVKAKVDELTSPDAINTLIYNFQNKYIDLKNIKDRIVKMGGQITDLNDAYLGEETYHSKVMKRGKDFLANELKPLLQQLHNSTIKNDDFEQFLHARHAPERNAEMAKRNPNQAMIDAGRAQAVADVKALEVQLQSAMAKNLATKAIDAALVKARAEKAKWHGAQAFQGTEDERNSLSGMSDAEAAQIMAALPAGRRSAMNSAAAKVDAINAKTLDIQLASGLIDKASFDAIKKAYQFYVPLHRDEAHPDQSAHSIGQGFSVKGAGIQRATGSNAKVTNILGHIAMQREAQNTRAEKNSVVKRLYLMAAQNPLKDFWSIDKPPMIKTIDERTGFVRSGVDPMYKNKPNVVMVRIAGKDVAIVFNEQNPEAVRLAEALKNLDGQELNVVERTFGRATRWIASVNTQYNPIFGLINFARDVQGAMFNLTTTELKDHKAATWKETFRLFKEITKSGFQLDKMNAADRALWEDFQNNGGATGYRDMFANPEERTKALEKELKALDGGPVAKKLKAAAQWLSDYNESMENVVRLAAYKVSLQNGMSKERAASLAKNLTVNFNRKGAKAQKLGVYYAFFNASIQGSTRLAETLKGPAGRKIIAGGIALGVMQQMLGMMMMGGDDGEDEWENVPDFIKERSIVIPLWKIGKDDPVPQGVYGLHIEKTKTGQLYGAIPMPLGFNVIPNIGRLFAEWATGGSDKPTGAQLAKLAGTIIGGFNPIGGTDLWDAGFPTPLDPIVALLRNKDWTGKPIYREDMASLDPTPGFTRTKDSATPWAKGLAYAVNWSSGGTDYQPGRFSWTPDQIDYVIGTVTGGAGRELGKLAQTLAAPFSADELPMHKVPLFGRVIGSTAGVSGQSGKFYENIRTLNGFEREIKGRAEAGEDTEEYENSDQRIGLISDANGAEKQVKELRKRQKVKKAEGDNVEVKEIDARIAEVMKELNVKMREASR